MKLNILLWLSLFVFMTSCASVDSISVIEGRVVDESGVGISGAMVYVSGREIETDINGYFCSQRIHIGAVFISVNKSGYKSVVDEFVKASYRLEIISPTNTANELPSMKSEILDLRLLGDSYCYDKN